MTTAAAANLYLAQHLRQWEQKGYAVYNPKERPLEELPVIYGFNNGGYGFNNGEPQGWYNGVILAQDGTHLGGHICSHEGYMLSDLGILDGSRPDRHETFQKHYPDGYRMDFVPASEVESHEGIKAAYQANQASRPTET